MRACFDRSFAVLFDFAAPENRLPRIVTGFELQPHIESIYGAAGEKVADLARAYDHINLYCLAGLQRNARSVGGRCDFAYVANHGRRILFGFFAYRETRV